MRIAVLGSGAVGSFCALELALSGAHVTRFGAEARPGEASAVAGAMLGVYGEVTRETFTSQFSRDRFRLDKMAKYRWDDLLMEFNEEAADNDCEPVEVASSTLIIHNAVGSGAIDDANWAAIRSALERDQAEHHHLDSRELLDTGLRPAAMERPLEGLWVPSEKAIDPVQLIKVLTNRFRRAGGTDCANMVHHLIVEDGSVRGVMTEDGERHETDVVVVAAGAFSADLIAGIPELKDVPPLFSGAGVALIAQGAPASLKKQVIRTPNRAFACGLHAIPRGPQRWYLGATNHLVGEPAQYPLFEDLRFVLECAQGQIHRGFADSRVTAVHAGNRPVSADGAPIIGSTRIDGLFLATGTYREGVHLSPLIGEYIAAIVQGKVGRAEFASFAPHRAPHPRDRGATIADTVEQSLAAADEYKWTAPHWVEDSLRHAWETHFADMLDRLPGDFVPPPELLTVMHTQPTLRRALINYYTALCG